MYATEFSAPTMRLLEFLRITGEITCTQKELAERLGMSRASISFAVRILVREGYVLRTGSYRGSTYLIERRGVADPSR